MKSCLKEYLTPVKYAQMATSRNENRKQGKIKETTSEETDFFFLMCNLLIWSRNFTIQNSHPRTVQPSYKKIMIKHQCFKKVYDCLVGQHL